MTILHKAAGIVLIIVGFWFLKYFPDMSDYQRKEMTMTGILMGITFFLVGIGLLIFG
jgi:hypothetical protein